MADLDGYTIPDGLGTDGLEPLQVAGLREMQRTLKALPGQLGKRVVMGGLRAAGKIIKEDAQERAPVLQVATPARNPGTVRDSIVVKTSKQDTYGVYIGIRKLRGKHIAQFKRDTGRAGSQNPNDPYYWWQLEFGNAKMRARPFLRPAFHAKAGAATRRFQAYVLRRLEREARKVAIEMGWR